MTKEQKAEKIAEMETVLLNKMGASLKAMLMLHTVIHPMQQKLAKAMEQMSEEERSRAEKVVEHMQKMDALTGAALPLLKMVQQAQKGTAEEKKAAIVKLMVGLGKIQKGVKVEMMAMRGMPGFPMMPSPDEDPEPGMGPGGIKKLLAAMEEKVKEELADPKRKNDPLVAVDVKMLNSIKKVMKKSEMLMAVGVIMMKKAKTKKEKELIKMKVQDALKKVLGNFKNSMQELQTEAQVILAKQAQKAKSQAGEEEQGSDPTPATHSEDKAAPAEEDPMNTPDDNTPDEKEPAPAAHSEADAPEPKDAPKEDAPKDDAPKDGDAQSDSELPGLLDQIDAIGNGSQDPTHLRAH